MMKGQIFKLAGECQKDILIFKENKDGLSFYAPNLREGGFDKDLETVRCGIFTNFYPKDEWYLKVLRGILENSVPEFSPVKDKEECLKRAFELCSCHTGYEKIQTTPENHLGLDGIHYMSEGSGGKKERKRRFDDSDIAFFLYRVKKITDSVDGDGLFLSETGKKLILSMAFLEADMVRCIKRQDTSVIIKRAEDTAKKYLDYYYDDAVGMDHKGKLSRAYGEFLRIIFFLSGSNALQDDKFIV